MANRRRLLIGAASNGLAFVAQLAVAFFLSPILLHALGRSRCGVWSVVESCLAYFTLFDLGLAATIVRFVPQCRAAGDSGRINRIVSACLLLFSAAAALVLIAGILVFAGVIHGSTRIPDELRDEAFGLAVVSLSYLSVSLPLSVFPAILDGLGRFATKNFIRVAFLATRVAATIFVLNNGASLIHLAVVQLVTGIGEHLVMAGVVYRLLPGLRAAPWRADRETLRLIRGYSVDSFLAMLAGRIAFKTDALVIGLFGQLDLIPFFDMPSRLVEYAKGLIRTGTTTLTPAFSKLDAQGDIAAVRRLYLAGCRCAFYMALPIQIALILFGPAFLELWLRDSAFRTISAPVLWLLASGLGIAMLQSVAARVLYGIGKIRGFARLMLLEAAINLVLSVILIGPLGITGVAIGTILPNVAMCVIVIVVVGRLVETTFREFTRDVLWRPLLPAMTLIPIWPILAMVIPPDSRLNFAILMAAGLAIYLVQVAIHEGQWHAVTRFLRKRPSPVTAN
jgi:O-antigen/teichoic acid export membrane protein